MINRIGGLAAFILMLLSSCSNEAGKPDSETKGTAEQAKETKKETSELQHAFPQFFSYLAQQDPSFSVSKFQQSESIPLDSVQAFPLDKKQLKPFSGYLIYNNDRSLAIDLYSYNYVAVQRNGKTVLEQGGPDTEVGLINVKDNTRQRIFFSGPGTSVQQAKWENGNTVFLAGVEETGPDAVKPVLWKINLAEKTMAVYHYGDTLHANVNNYAPAKTTLSF
jgi:hypothetical protein